MLRSSMFWSDCGHQAERRQCGYPVFWRDDTLQVSHQEHQQQSSCQVTFPFKCVSIPFMACVPICVFSVHCRGRCLEMSASAVIMMWPVTNWLSPEQFVAPTAQHVSPALSHIWSCVPPTCPTCPDTGQESRRSRVLHHPSLTSVSAWVRDTRLVRHVELYLVTCVNVDQTHLWHVPHVVTRMNKMKSLWLNWNKSFQFAIYFCF